MLTCICAILSSVGTQAPVVKRVRVKNLLVRNRNLTVIESLIPVMNRSQTEVQIQSLNQTTVTRVIMTHQVHHHDRISCITIHALYIHLTPLAVTFSLAKSEPLFP